MVEILTDSSRIRKNGKAFLKWKVWENMTPKWADYTSPFRPSRGDIKNYKKILKGIGRKRKVLILGATPELRDIAAKMNLNVVLADFSIDMIQSMLKYTKLANPNKEIWIKSDWFNMPLKENYFDAVLGDGVLRMVNKEQVGEFLKKIFQLLKLNGYFITRAHFINESMVNKSIKEIVSEIFTYYRDQKVEICNTIISMMFDKFSDKSKGTINRKQAIQALKNYSALFNKKYKIPNLITELWPKIERKWSVFDKKELERLFKKFFVITNIKKSTDYLEADFYPIYVLVRRRVELK